MRASVTASCDSSKEIRASGASGEHVRGCFRVPEHRSNSDSETDHDRQQPSGRVHLLCPGCNKSFTNISSLRRHRNSRWLPFCRAAASALKRPRIVRVYDSESAQDAIDRINEMMGDGTNRGVPPRAALNPYLQPRDEVGGVQSQPKVYTQFATGLHAVYTTFELDSHMGYM